jgi:hypothetical protein
MLDAETKELVADVKEFVEWSTIEWAEIMKKFEDLVVKLDRTIKEDM